MFSCLRTNDAAVQLLSMRRTIRWHVGHIVVVLREEMRWTQPQLAKKAGVNKATVVSVEAMDRNHGRQTYEKIAHAFGLSMAELFALVPEAHTTQETQRPAAVAETLPSTGTAGSRFHVHGARKKK